MWYNVTLKTTSPEGKESKVSVLLDSANASDAEKKALNEVGQMYAGSEVDVNKIIQLDNATVFDGDGEYICRVKYAVIEEVEKKGEIKEKLHKYETYLTESGVEECITAWKKWANQVLTSEYQILGASLTKIQFIL